MESRSLYTILGVDEKATTDEIKSAYKKRVSRLHPDTSGCDSYEEFVEVTNAYNILSDIEKRKKYDEEGYTGEEEQDKKQAAYEIITQWFKGILTKAINSNIDVVKELNKLNKTFYAKIHQNIKNSQKSKKELYKIKKRLRRKSKKKNNYCLLKSEIEKEILNYDMSIAQSFRDMEVCRIISTILSDYDFDMTGLEEDNKNGTDTDKKSSIIR